MDEYYQALLSKYSVALDAGEREKVEEYTGFCPTFLVGLGNRLASESINHRPQPSVEDIFLDSSFQTNYQKHYKEFLARMKDDGAWDELVQIIMGISSIRIEPDSEDTFRKATINKLCCRGYLREKESSEREKNIEYVVFSDDFSAWARNKLYNNEIYSIYSRIIMAEVAIKELLKAKMPQIWNARYPGCDWENDFLNDSSTVPYCAKHLTSNNLKSYLRTAQKYNSSAGVADALTMKVKLSLLQEYWQQGISDAFNSEPYSDWEECFDQLREIRNPLFHAVIIPNSTTTHHYFLLKDVNEQANRVIQQLSR
jgi:hypothetical protein